MGDIIGNVIIFCVIFWTLQKDRAPQTLHIYFPSEKYIVLCSIFFVLLLPSSGDFCSITIVFFLFQFSSPIVCLVHFGYYIFMLFWHQKLEMKETLRRSVNVILHIFSVVKSINKYVFAMCNWNFIVLKSKSI